MVCAVILFARFLRFILLVFRLLKKYLNVAKWNALCGDEQKRDLCVRNRGMGNHYHRRRIFCHVQRSLVILYEFLDCMTVRVCG